MVCGINDPQIKKQLLQEKDLTFETAEQLALTLEVAARDVTDIQKSASQASPQSIQRLHHTRTRARSQPHNTHKHSLHVIAVEELAIVNKAASPNAMLVVKLDDQQGMQVKASSGTDTWRKEDPSIKGYKERTSHLS